MRESLAELANKQEGLLGSTDRERNGYFSGFYENAFAKYRDQDINLLEIGSAYGGGLMAWHDWFSCAQITGVDIRNHTPEGKIQRSINEHDFINYPEVFLVDPVKYPRVKNYGGYNAYTQEFADSLPMMDIIIDDAWHSVDQWDLLYKLYLRKMNPGGIMVIEDIVDNPINATAGWTINTLIEPIKHLKHEVITITNHSGPVYLLVIHF
jgi:hypothetical protein